MHISYRNTLTTVHSADIHIQSHNMFGLLAAVKLAAFCHYPVQNMQDCAGAAVL